MFYRGVPPEAIPTEEETPEFPESNEGAQEIALLTEDVTLDERGNTVTNQTQATRQGGTLTQAITIKLNAKGEVILTEKFIVSSGGTQILTSTHTNAFGEAASL